MKRPKLYINFFILIIFQSIASAQITQDWKTTYFGKPIEFHDIPAAVTSDAENNIYVTAKGKKPDREQTYIQTFKYDSTGKEIWQNNYLLDYGKESSPLMIRLDNENKVIVVGEEHGQSFDFLILKYDEISGETIWKSTFNCGRDSTTYDRVIDMEIDQNGDIYVLGDYYILNNYKISLVKISKNGETLWYKNFRDIVTPYSNSSEFAQSVTVDRENNVYINGKGADQKNVTIKLSSDGETLWLNTYNFLSWSSDLITDLNNNLYIATSGSVNKMSSDGRLIWSKDIKGGSDLHFNSKYSKLFTCNSSTEGIVFNCLDTAGNLIWQNKISTSPDFEYCTIIRVINDEIYGSWSNSVFKINTSGNISWIKTFNSDPNYKLTKNNFTSVRGGIVASVPDKENFTAQDVDAVTLKYDLQGNLKKKAIKKTNRMFAEDTFLSSVKDTKNNIYVLASVSENGGHYYEKYDFAVLKYNSAGNIEWVRYFNGITLGKSSMILDKYENIVVAGVIELKEKFEYVTALKKFDQQGNELKERKLSNYYFEGRLRVDDSNAIYISMSNSIVKLNSELQDILTIDLADNPVDFVLDNNKNIIVIHSFKVAKYTNRGLKDWEISPSSVVLYSLSIDSSNHAYITGSRIENYREKNIVAMKITGEGVVSWETNYDPINFSYSYTHRFFNNHLYIPGWGGYENKLFILKYNTDGVLVSKIPVEDISIFAGDNPIQFDFESSIYILGKVFYSQMPVLVKFNKNEEFEWRIDYPTNKDESSVYVHNFIIDDNARIYFLGSEVNPTTYLDVVISKYSQNSFLNSTIFAPTQLSGRLTSFNQIKLSWVDNSDNEEGFLLERATSNIFDNPYITTLGKEIVWYEDLNLLSDTKYYYRIKCYNRVKESTYSNWVEVETKNKLTSINEGLIKGIFVYPVPSTGEIKIIGGGIQQNSQLSFFDIHGKKYPFILSHAKNEEALISFEAPSGVYFLKIINGSNFTTIKVIKE